MKKIYSLVCILLLVACNTNDNETNKEESFNVKQLLTDVTNNRILVSVEEFVNEASLLNDAAQTYVTTTNENNLTLLRQQWQETALSYAKVYAFNIGAVRDQFMHQALYNWPTVPNAIENFITNNASITSGIIGNLSPQAKSLSGLEYLIFKTNLSDTNTEFINSEKRRNYLKFSALELKSQANRLLNIWQASGGNFAEILINSEATGIQSSFSKLYNGLYNLIDTGKVTKIGKPAGLENSQNTNPDLTQAYFSHTSLAILKKNIESVKNVYFNPNGLGIDDYVFSIVKNNELNNAVQNKITEVQAAIDEIPGNLYDAITTNHDKVEALHQRLDELGVLFSVDVRSVLSITITSTDNDGD